MHSPTHILIPFSYLFLKIKILTSYLSLILCGSESTKPIQRGLFYSMLLLM